eukprot:2532647-Rhodomonas_salina.2
MGHLKLVHACGPYGNVSSLLAPLIFGAELVVDPLFRFRSVASVSRFWTCPLLVKSAGVAEC